MPMSISTVTLVAVLALALFLAFLNLAFWRTQRTDRTPLWLAAWLSATAIFSLCRLLQYASLNEQVYLVIPRVLLTAGFLLAWLGYEFANTFIGYRSPRWERPLIIFLVAMPVMLLWTSNLILTDQAVMRTVLFGGSFHGVAVGILYLPASILILGIGVIPPARLLRAPDLNKRDNYLIALGFLFVIFFSLNDFVSTALDLPWIRLSDYSYLPVALFFSFIQVQRLGVSVQEDGCPGSGAH